MTKKMEKVGEAADKNEGEELTPCSGCVAAKVKCIMDVLVGSKMVACYHYYCSKLACVWPGEKKERQRKQEEAVSPRGQRRKWLGSGAQRLRRWSRGRTWWSRLC